MKKLLGYNDLKRAAAWLTQTLGEDWDPAEVVDAAVRFGIPLYFWPPEVPLDDLRPLSRGLREGCPVHIMFPQDLNRVRFKGEGLLTITIVDGLACQFMPGLPFTMDEIRIMEDGVLRLAERLKSKPETQMSDKIVVTQDDGLQLKQGPIDESDSSFLEQPQESPFDPLPISGIARMFMLKQNENQNIKYWKSLSRHAKRNGLAHRRVRTGKGTAESLFDPLAVGDWIVEKGHMTRDKMTRVLANNLPKRSVHLKDLLQQ